MASRFSLALILVSALLGCGRSDTPREVPDSGWSGARIDSLRILMPDLMERFNVPGTAVVLTSGNEVQWAAGFGRTGPRDAPITPNTIFQLASLGKPVFAHLLHRLEQARPWSLSDSIAAWSPPGSYPPGISSVSAVALLSHTAGVRYDSESDRVYVEPDARGHWEYSSTGYVVLQQAVESAEARTLEELSKDLLIDSLGLSTMSYVAPRAGLARGHDRSGRPRPNLEWTEANAASSLYSSATDYAHFLMSVARMGGPEPPSWDRMTRPQTAVEEDLGLYWGLGWALEQDSNDALVVFHWGSNPGFKSFALLDRERAMGLVVLTNGDQGLELIEQVVNVVDPESHPLFQFFMLHPDD